VADTSTWTLTHITFDTEAGTWCLKGERCRPPFENACLYATGPSFAEALVEWEAQSRGHRRNYRILNEADPLSAQETDAATPPATPGKPTPER
jgi:hypothetical protein